MRQKYIQAQEYRDKLQRGQRRRQTAAAGHLPLEALVEILDGKRQGAVPQPPPQRHQHPAAAWARSSASRRSSSTAASPGRSPTRSPRPAASVSTDLHRLLRRQGGGPRLDPRGRRPAREGRRARVSFNTDDGITDSRFLMRAAAISVRYGMSREKALEASDHRRLRSSSASRIASARFEAGKDADLVVLSGRPLLASTARSNRSGWRANRSSTCRTRNTAGICDRRLQGLRAAWPPCTPTRRPRSLHGSENGE